MGGEKEILFEFIVNGNVVKVTAIDPVTGAEASIVGPATAPRASLQQVALQKLRYLLKKTAG